MNSDYQQNEIKHFWRCSGALREARRSHAPPEAIAEYIEELDLLARDTDSPSLRARCKAAISEDVASMPAVVHLTTG